MAGTLEVSQLSQQRPLWVENGDEVKARGKLGTVCIRGRENRFKAVPIPAIVRRRILAQASPRKGE